MNEQRFKMKTLGAIFLISLLTFGCGDAGTTGGAQGDGSPTLGITSVQKPEPQAGKPNFALHLMNKGLGFLFGNPVIAQTTPACPPIASPASAITIPMTDGMIYVTQAYTILDEVEFGLPTNFPHRQTGPFALDLTNTDPFVPESVSLSAIPPDNYTSAQFKIGRLDSPDEVPPINLGTHLDTFMLKLFAPVGAPAERRPSIWIEGFMQTNTIGSACKPFTFFTDKDHTNAPQIVFNIAGTIDPSQLDIVLFIKIERAFTNALVGVSDTPVQDFIGEIGSSIFLGDFLDGRTFKKPQTPDGTPNAVKLANELFKHLNVFTQPKGSFTGTMEADASQAS